MAPGDGHHLLRTLWPEVPKNDFSEKVYSRYIDHLKSELSILETLPDCFAATDQAEELEILGIVKQTTATPQYQVLEKVGARYGFQPSNQQGQTRCQASVELAARIWLTVNIDSFKFAAASQAIPLPARTGWDDRQMSLRMLVLNQFPTSTAGQQPSEQIPSSLNMMELCSRSKYSVRWTHNLSEHLTITEERGSNVILVYEHLICLLNHRRYPEDSGLPREIVEEAIDTFVLLFPLSSPKVKRFLRREEREFYALGYDGRGQKRQLQLDHYRYWRKSIVQMIAIMARPPRGWRQAILDKERRNFEQVVTIWVGAFATIITVVALVFGILSTLLALEANKLAAEANSLANESLKLGREANKLARDAYELDRRQACLGHNATEDLPEFCL
ncbi:hypothetical protein BGZ63DRAFT_169926 [Mariannaea sp. PMI_226]|nr:hypothetical protein BGZ63DRAFT_169926 [Mariannaea sp. PMI_226]